MLQSDFHTFVKELARVAKNLEEIEMDNLTKEQQLEMVKQIPTLKKLNSVDISNIVKAITVKDARECWIILRNRIDTLQWFLHITKTFRKV